MKGLLRRLCSALLLCALLLGLTVSASAAFPRGETEKEWSVRVYFDGLLTERGYGCRDGVYLSVQGLCAFLGVPTESFYSKEEKTLVIYGQGLDLNMAEERDYLLLNERPIPIEDSDRYVEHRGDYYFPIELLARFFHLDYTVSADQRRVDIVSESMTLPEGGSSYYSETYGLENFFWLTRVVYAEAGNQPLEGKIAVANVVLNRVESPYFPDNIKDVVFDDAIVIQFQVTTNGTIYAEPDEESVLAAKLALEGKNVCRDSLFFVSPRAVDDTWFKENRTFVCSIGDHDFYL